MQNIFIEFLPPWVETGLQPAFYDKESGTVLQQTARMYAKIHELIKAFNDLSAETKATVEEYIAKFVELYNYVHDYFENLDVQEEINNKLDDMVEEGTLQEIITTYIQSNVTWTFDTVADMKLATNLVSGSYARTLGYSSINDGGDAYYLITDTPDLTAYQETLSGGLYATLQILDDLTTAQFGVQDGDNITTILTKIASMEVSKLKFIEGTYYVDDTVTFNASIDIDFNNSTIISSAVEETFKFNGQLKGSTALDANYALLDSYYTVVDNSDIAPKDLIVIGNDELFSYARTYYKKGIVSNVSGTDNYNIYIEDKLPYTLIKTDSVVKTYYPMYVNIKNLKLIGAETLTIDKQKFGILLKHCSESSLKNIYTDNFLYNIYILESNKVYFDSVDTNRAVVSGIAPGTTYNAYGMALNGSNFYIKNSSFNSGQHGITTTNTPESCRTVFNVYVENCTVKSEHYYGFGAHNDTVNVQFKDSTIYGFVAIHNTSFDSCILYNIGSNYSTVSFTDAVDLTNYKFNQCKFIDNSGGLPILRATSFESNEQSLDLINKVELVNCNNAKVTVSTRAGMNASAKVNKITISNCYNIAFKEESLTVGKLNYINNEYNYNDLCIEIASTLGDINIKDCVINPRYRIFRFNGTTNIVNIDNIDFTQDGISTTNTIEFPVAPAKVYFNKVISKYTNLRLFADQYFDFVMTDSIIDNRITLTGFASKNLTIRNSKIDAQNIRNVFTNANYVHFYEQVADDGTVSYTVIS